MFEILPSEIDKIILTYVFTGIKCCFCKKIFTVGFYDKNRCNHICKNCAASIMYERGSMGLFEKYIYIDNTT